MTANSKIELIIFDFDGTLGDTRQNIVTTMQMTIAELRLPSRSDAECTSTIGLPLYGCFETLYPDTDKKIIQQCTDTYRRIFQENLQTIKPQTFPKVVETLTTLKKQGYSLAIASSRNHASLVELTHDLGISETISYLIGADDVEKAKPDPEPVLSILAALGYDARQTLVVGDMDVDILMGLHAGVKTCGVTYGNGTKRELEEAGADFIIDSIDELVDSVLEIKSNRDIYVAGGCFWGTEHYFKQIEGVVETSVGFANGNTVHPTYKEVYTDTTGHAETVHVKYNSDIVSLEFLLQMFFKAIDPTSLNKQGHDEGTRYRTGIYYTNADDLPIIEKVFAEEQKNYQQPLAVEKLPLENFYSAEEYHQDYLDKNPTGYCHLPQSLFEFAKKAKDSKTNCRPSLP